MRDTVSRTYAPKVSLLDKPLGCIFLYTVKS